jgi:hypothetical protein
MAQAIPAVLKARDAVSFCALALSSRIWVMDVAISSLTFKDDTKEATKSGPSNSIADAVARVTPTTVRSCKHRLTKLSIMKLTMRTVRARDTFWIVDIVPCTSGNYLWRLGGTAGWRCGWSKCVSGTPWRVGRRFDTKEERVRSRGVRGICGALVCANI